MSATSLGLVHQRAEVDAVLQVVPTVADEVLAFRDVLVEVPHPGEQDPLAAGLGLDHLPRHVERLLPLLALLARGLPVLDHEPVAVLVPLLLDHGPLGPREPVLAHGLHLLADLVQELLEVGPRHLLEAREGVLLLVPLGLRQHPFDVLRGQAALLVGDLDLRLAVRPHVLGRDLEDAVGVQREGHRDLGHAAEGLRDAVQRELPEEVVVGDLGALALVDADGDLLLVVLRGAEVLRLRGRDRGVALDELAHEAPHGLDAEGQRRDVEEEHALHLGRAAAGHDGSLDGSAVGDGLVGVDVLAQGLPIEELGDQVLHPGDARGPADHDDLLDHRLRETAVGQALRDRLHRLLEVVHAELLELGARDPHAEVVAVV
mmetsp:Transcript_54808/g.161154  ORF Transcript_54808/g.161154 Transcript_54808/m.161154 type:complete len:374 (+) Transcript_54808:24-1145(+)